MDEVDLPLTVLDTDTVLKICAKECGGKCCNFYLNDFVARVNIEDYKKLNRHNLEEFVIWDHGDPQLPKQPGGECIFLHPETKQCSIYEIRPLDCRNFPYFMPEQNIADHCLLYYNSSEELIKRERAKTHDVPEFNKSYNELTSVEREYISYLQEQPSLDVNKFLQYEELIETSTSYISIVYTDEEALEEAHQFIKKEQEQLDATYQVLSVLGTDNSFSYTFHLLGVIRSSPAVPVDYISEFPSSLQEVEELLDYVNYNKYHRLTAGILLSKKQYQRLSEQVYS